MKALVLTVLMIGVLASLSDQLQAENIGADLALLDDWRIVVALDAIPSERFAAEYFQTIYREASGVVLPIVNQAEPDGSHVFIGPAAAASAGVTLDHDWLGDEGLRIVVRADMIVIAGGRPRGTLYGVYQFLEDYMGVRFLTSDHTHVPPIGTWHGIGEVDRRYRPPLVMRWNDVLENQLDHVFASRLRCNAFRPFTNPHPSRPGEPDPKVGGVVNWVLINHSFHRMMPSSVYGEEHPEYYALWEGERLAPVEHDSYQTEPCPTHPDVQRIITEATFAEIEAHPDRSNVSVTQNDTHLYCQCPTCQQVIDREGSPMGPLLTLVNHVADAVAEKHPGVEVGTLAYHATVTPPRHLRPRPNVQIQFAPIQRSQYHAIDDRQLEVHTEFCRMFETWSELTGNLYVWDYNINFSNYLLPIANVRAIGPTIRYYVSEGVRGIMFENAHLPCSGLADLRNYVTSQMLWNPSQDDRELERQFISLHYGPAAPPIQRYIDRVHDHVEQSGIARRCFGTAAEHGLTGEIVRAGHEAVEEAHRLADSPELGRRIDKLSLAIHAAAIDELRQHVEEHGPDEVPAALLDRTRADALRFFELCDAFGVEEYRETHTIDSLRRAFDTESARTDG